MANNAILNTGDRLNKLSIFSSPQMLADGLSNAGTSEGVKKAWETRKSNSPELQKKYALSDKAAFSTDVAASQMRGATDAASHAWKTKSPDIHRMAGERFTDAANAHFVASSHHQEAGNPEMAAMHMNMGRELQRAGRIHEIQSQGKEHAERYNRLSGTGHDVSEWAKDPAGLKAYDEAGWRKNIAGSDGK